MSNVCNVCGSADVKEIFTLPDYPLNSLYIPASSNEKKFVSDFEMHQCKTCFHIQGVSKMSLDAFYNDDYSYTTNNSGVQGRQSLMVNHVLQHAKGKKFNRVIEIGCYNLSLMKKLKEEGVSANHWIGIDPVPLKKADEQEGILFMQGYVQDIEIPHLNNELPDLIISDQVFEHVPRINEVLAAFSKVIAPNSSFIVCVPSVELLIENYSYHNIIHEHINYYSEGALANLFNGANFKLEYSELNNEQTCGFLLQRYSNPSGFSKKEIVNTYDFLPKFERNYKTFQQNMSLTNDIINNNVEGKLYGFGASDITANFAYFLKSDFSKLTNIIDDTPYKHNRFIPHLKPRIVKTSEITDINEATILITAPQASRPIARHLISLKPKKIINPLNIF